MPATPAWLASLEVLLNRRIAESASAREAARRLAGSAARLDIEGVMSVRAAVSGERLILTRAGGEPVDVRIAGTPGALIELALVARPRGAPRAADAPEPRVRIEGDAELAARYRELLRLARPDIEEELSRWLGDLPARGLMRLARSAALWGRQASRSAAQNVTEYLTEERRELVGRGELEEFLLEVDRVREMADRVEARLTRLERELKDSR